MLKGLLEKERDYINHFFDHVDLEAADKVVQFLNDCSGMIILSGVGKSGLVANKIAVTLTSTGTKAFYLPVLDALHGDIGIVSKQDTFVMLSKSGESDELLNLLPYLRNRGVPVIAIVSNPDSRLAKACDMYLHLPLKAELCSFNMVPTTSTIIQMMFGDLLAVALMNQKKFSMDQYAMNHPAGRIGRRITMKVQDLMLKGKDLPTCQAQDTLVESLVELSSKRCGCIAIVSAENSLEGIFTDGDLRRSLQSFGAAALSMTMGELMTKTPKNIGPEALAFDAMQLMENNQKSPITVLPVIGDKNTLVGVIKMHDIIQSGI